MTDTLCLKCQEEILDDEQSITCSECGSTYHCGSCAGISEVTLKTKGETYRSAWKCPTCRTSKLKKGATNKPKSDVDVSTMLVSMNNKLDELLDLKETVGGIEASISMMSAKYDEILESVKGQREEIKQLKSKVAELEGKDNGEEVKRLRNELHDLEWRNRKLNLEFHGITKTKDEDLMSKINEIAPSLELPELAEAEITALHRLPSKPDKIPGIIVRFASQTTRDAWLSRRGKLRNTGNKYFINENLTKQNRELLAKAKEWTKGKGFMYVWHRNGKVFIRRKDGDDASVIRSEDDLKAIHS